jgi:integrase
VHPGGSTAFFYDAQSWVQEWLGHESLATTQKYLGPSKETEKQFEAMKLPF